MPDLWMDVDAAVTVPVNILPLLDDTDFKTRETAVVYNAAGLELVWNFVTSAGVQTHVAVTPTDTGGAYDWVNIGHGMYNIELPASAGASANNDTEGFGWFVGIATGVLPWRGPIVGFRTAALNNALIDGGASLSVDLNNDAITSAKFDESTAFPLKSADTGATAVARVGADSDTLETLSDQLDSVATSLGTIAPTTDTADAFAQDHGTVISGTYTNTQTDDDVRHVLAPDGGGLDVTYTFACGTNRAPTAVTINGYFNGAAQYADVYAYDYGLALWNKLTNSTTRMNTRNNDLNYSYALNRDHMDIITNPGYVLIRFVSASTNGAHRLNLDRITVNTVSDANGEIVAASTPQQIWEYAQRTLTSESGEEAPTDPWTTALPGAYAVGQAGYIVGQNLNATITSRLAPATAGRTLEVDASGVAQADVRAIEGALTSGNNATLKLAGLDIRGAAESAVTVYIEGGSGTFAGGYGVYIVGGANAGGTGADAVFIGGGAGTENGGNGLSISGGSAVLDGDGIAIIGSNGIEVRSDSVSGYAINMGVNGVLHGTVDGLNDLNAQEVRNALALVNTVAPAAGSIDKHLDDAPSMAYLDAALTPIAKDSHVDELETRLTATRAAYLDNLAGGAVALNSTVAKDATVAKAATALSNLVWTDAKAGYITGSLALEATLTAIKGAGWTTETLRAIDTLLDAIKAKTDLLPADPTSAATLTAQFAALNDPSVAEIDAQLIATHGAGSWVDVPITAFSVTYTVTVGGVPTANVYCRMTTDAGGVANIDAGLTDALGQVTFHHNLPSGTTVYIWRTLAGYEFSPDPDTEVIP